MGVKSVIDVEVNDDEFKEFQKLFEKYQTQLTKTPSAWGSVSKETKAIEGSFAVMAAALLAQAEIARKTAADQKKFKDNSKQTSDYWKDMLHSTKGVAGNIVRATESLLKWASLTTVFSGLLGAGGLFGLDSLAAGVANTRRSAFGLNTTYGEKLAFGVDYSRFVDPESFLSSVNDALHDYSKRTGLYGAGLNEGDITGKNTAQIAALLLPKLKDIADRNNPAQYGNVIRALHLDQLGIGIQDLERLRATSPAELAAQARDYKGDVNALGLSPKNQLVWADFSKKLTQAGYKIENVFVRGLAPLAGPLGHLSDVIVGIITKWSQNGTLAHWIDQMAGGIQWLGNKLGSKEFADDVSSFVTNMGILAKELVNALRMLGLIPDAPPGKNASWGDVYKWNREHGRWSGAANQQRPYPAETSGIERLWNWMWGPNTNANNVGNMRVPGHRTGFAQFKTPEDGIRAMARQLQRDEDVHGLKTLQQIIGDKTWGWAPASDHNNVAAYVGDVSHQTGLDPNAKLDLHNIGVLSKVIAAMTHHENRRNKYTAGDITKVLIQNNSGGNAVVSASALGAPSVIFAPGAIR